ncbi:MAG: hypothetical protein JNK23_15935 [Opitutaceae bacterium]|nr:hypothetical protein [Opitutaceae bacterium]
MLPLLSTASRHPLPDWNACAAEAEAASLDAAGLGRFYTERGREWVHLLRDSFGKGYRGYESPNFWLVSSEPDATCQRLIEWAESIRAKVIKALALDHSGQLYGKCPMIVAHDLDAYYDYIAQYLSDGEHALTGGIYLNVGYGHFVFTFHDMNNAELVLAHELAHALVSHLPLPLWLNEGIAQLCEVAVTGRDTTPYEEVHEKFDSYWTGETIQQLWNGEGFNRQDEGQQQSYYLARLLTRNLTGDIQRFRSFVHEADASDAGTAALLKPYGIRLSDMVAQHLGDGDWAPRLPLWTPPESVPDHPAALPSRRSHSPSSHDARWRPNPVSVLLSS